MTAMPVAQAMTAQEFINLPVPEHGRPWNLVEGEVVVNHPTWAHAQIQIRLVMALGAWMQAGADRGDVSIPVDVEIDDRTSTRQTFSGYAHGRAPGWHSTPPAPMPDLAAEVRSPSTWRHDVGAKKSGYEREGCVSCG